LTDSETAAIFMDSKANKNEEDSMNFSTGWSRNKDR
jgi:hypothetical protein